MKFRKKPVEVEAIQFDPQKEPWPRPVHPWSEADYQPRDMSWGFIETLEGKMHASAGDWIVKGVNGEFYPVKQDIFAKTYEQI